MITLSAFQKLMLAFFVFITGMIACRMMYAQSLGYIFLLWNLFLAWIPFKISLWLSAKDIGKWKAALLIAVWLLFFPNALYIITDLIHLEQKTNVPVWYDAILLFTCAITGLLLAFASLYKVELFLYRQMSSIAVNKVIVFCLFIGSFGVYLGRFLRWNSWDILTNPGALAWEISMQFISPVQHYRTWAITILLTILFSLLYFTMKILPQYAVPVGKRGRETIF